MSAATGAVRIVTLNTWKCDGAYRDRVAAMARGLKALVPDVVLLQEAFLAPSLGLDTAATLADPLGAAVIRHRSREKPRTIGGSGETVVSTAGLATLVRGEVTGEAVLDLPKDPADGDRQALVVSARIGAIPLLLVNTHLSHLPGRDDLRGAQLDCLLEGLTGWTEGTHGIVLGGDFNAGPESAVITDLMGRTDWRVSNARGQEHTPTLLPEDPGAAPVACIDFLFLMDPAERRTRMSVTAARRVLDAPDPVSGIYPSDHFGVLADIASA